MKDLNYFPLDVESNIYGMTTLEFEDRTTKVLVATRNCQIYCINYSKFKPQTREVEFTYIPNGAKIISIGALKRGTNDFVIGITHSLAPNLQKNPTTTVTDYNKSTTYYFNIYASGSISQKFDLDYVAQGCQTIRLRYVPYHLYNTELVTIQGEGSATNQQQQIVKKRPFWLLSGGDKAIHAFSEDRPYQSFNEVPIEECFPELANIQGLALWIDVLNIQDTLTCFQRVVALGFEDGTVRLYQSVMSSKTSNKYETVRVSSFDDYNTIVPCVRLFKVKATAKSLLRDKLECKGILKNKQSTSNFPEKLNLLVISSTNSSLVFENVLHAGLDRKFELPESQRLDCVTSATVGDTNVDGFNELLIGTHGKELLTYRYNCSCDRFELDQISLLNYPVFALTILDLTGDGLKDVIILLENGVLIMQAIVKDVVTSLKSRLDNLLTLLQ